MSTHLITALLAKAKSGDNRAKGELLDRVYRELRKVASAQMRSERPGHTLQPTALVHEAYLRIFRGDKIDWQNRTHFFAIAASEMRRVLVDHARLHLAGKRGAGAVQLSLEDRDVPGQHLDEDILAVDIALEELAQVDSRASRVVELKFFGDLTDQEAAETLGINFAAERRDWQFARAWLLNRLTAGKQRPARVIENKSNRPNK